MNNTLFNIAVGVWGIPSVFLVDKNGVVNALNLRDDRTEAAVKALLDTN